MNRVVDSNKLERAQISGMDEPSVRWAGAFATYGEHGASQSSTIVYEIEPGGRLGWHTDATEETQYISTGKETLRAVVFFAAAMFTQRFDNVMLPPKNHLLGTPNRES